MTEFKKQQKVIAVAVVDDDVNIRDGLWWLLNNVKGLQCIGAYANWPEAMVAFSGQAPDVLLLDVSLPGTSGIDAIEPMLVKFQQMKIIMHSNYDHEDKILHAKQSGASGYVLKNASAPVLHDAILQVYRGGSVWPPGYSDSDPASPITGRAGILRSLPQKAKKFVNSLFGRLRILE